MNINTMAESNIVEFFEDRSIFITGATGFMGKVLVEKLLRSCPGINRLYLLMRPSKGKEVTTRLQELISNEVKETHCSLTVCSNKISLLHNTK